MAKDFWQQAFALHHVLVNGFLLPSPRVHSNRPQSWQHCGNTPEATV